MNCNFVFLVGGSNIALAQGSKKFLILREVPDEKVKKLLSDKESLAACDIAIFVYDRWERFYLKGASF